MLKATKYSDLPPRTPGSFLVFLLDGINTSFELWKDIESFLEHLELLPTSSRCYYETVLQEELQKPRYDIDIPAGEWDHITIVNDLLLAINKVFRGLDIFLDYKDVQIFNSSGISKGLQKWSYHIVIDRYYHANSVEAMTLYKETLNLIKPDFRRYIDSAVYKSLQQFRLVGNTKKGENRTKVRLYQWNYNDTLLTWEPLNAKREFISSLLGVKEDISLYKKLFIDAKIAIPKNRVALELSYIEKLVPEGFELSGETEYGYKLKRVDSSMCLACKRIHEHENAYITVNNGLIVYKCFRDTHNYFVLGNIQPTQPKLKTNKRDLALKAVKHIVKTEKKQDYDNIFNAMYEYENIK